MSNYELSIGDLAQRTGVAQQTLRSWERRHGFPRAHRTASGHRRYSQNEVELVHAVAESRERGLSLGSAIATALSVRGSGSRELPAGTSVHARLLRTHPRLQSVTVYKAALIVLSHAAEDEILARGEPRVLFGTFQRERFYDAARARWRELQQGSQTAVVFADFRVPRRQTGHPIEIPIGDNRPLTREWSLIYCGHMTAFCLSARETTDSGLDSPSPHRKFELIFSVDPQVALTAAGICLRSTAQAFPELPGELAERLSVPPVAGPETQLEFMTAITRRALNQMFAPVSNRASNDPKREQGPGQR